MYWSICLMFESSDCNTTINSQLTTDHISRTSLTSSQGLTDRTPYQSVASCRQTITSPTSSVTNYWQVWQDLYFQSLASSYCFLPVANYWQTTTPLTSSVAKNWLDPVFFLSRSLASYWQTTTFLLCSVDKYWRNPLSTSIPFVIDHHITTSRATSLTSSVAKHWLDRPQLLP